MIPLLFLTMLQTPKVEFPPIIQGIPGSFVVIRPISLQGKSVKYFATSPGLAIFPADLLSDKTATVVSSVLSGEYTVIAYTALGDIPSDAAVIRVVIGNPPAPVPPTPPSPPPIDDPLLDSLKAVWGALDEPGKLDSKAKLAKIYRQCSEAYKDLSFINVGQAFERSKTISRSLLPDSALNSLRVMIGEELKKSLPVDPSTVLTQDLRSKITSQLDRMANLVDSLR